MVRGRERQPTATIQLEASDDPQCKAAIYVYSKQTITIKVPSNLLRQIMEGGYTRQEAES